MQSKKTTSAYVPTARDHASRVSTDHTAAYVPATHVLDLATLLSKAAKPVQADEATKAAKPVQTNLDH